jgi:hypothetical protein
MQVLLFIHLNVLKCRLITMETYKVVILWLNCVGLQISWISQPFDLPIILSFFQRPSHNKGRFLIKKNPWVIPWWNLVGYSFKPPLTNLLLLRLDHLLQLFCLNVFSFMCMTWYFFVGWWSKYQKPAKEQWSMCERSIGSSVSMQVSCWCLLFVRELQEISLYSTDSVLFSLWWQ